jgi:hypothetical protein
MGTHRENNRVEDGKQKLNLCDKIKRPDYIFTYLIVCIYVYCHMINILCHHIKFLHNVTLRKPLEKQNLKYKTSTVTLSHLPGKSSSAKQGRGRQKVHRSGNWKHSNAQLSKS